MIVKCEQCQTRFKIPDDKVTDKGVKVRCTKCSHTFRVTRDMAQSVTGVAPAFVPPPPGGDPFARFGAPSGPPDAEATRPGVFTLGVEATKRVAPPYPPQPGPAASTAVPFDFGSLTPPGAPTMPTMPTFVPPVAPLPAASPFDFAAIARPSPAAPPPPAAGFDFSNFAAPTQPMAPIPPVRPPPAAPVAPPAMPAFDFSAATSYPPQPSAFDMGGLPGAPPPPPPFPGAPSALAPSSLGSADGFFAGTEEAAPAHSPLDGAAARAMFDVPAPAPSALLDLPPPDLEPAARNVERVAPSKPQSAPPPVIAPVGPGGPPPRRRTAVGIVVNVVIAAMLVLGLVVVGSAYLNEGKFSTEALSLEGLKNTFAPSVTFVADDVSNGLYDTRAGRSVFFVRGAVINRSDAAVKIVVKAEIVEDDRVVRFGESWAGEPASPEEIFLIDNTEALEALNLKVEKRSLVVPAGAAAAFVVPFTEYPPDLKDFRVRVGARAVAVAPTAANP